MRSKAAATTLGAHRPGPQVSWQELARAAKWSVACTSCDATPDADPFRRCEKCGSSLDVRYDTAQIADAPEWVRGKPHTIWGYSELLPTVGVSVSLGEGDTPLRSSQRLAEAYARRVFWKIEAANPTHSHKDRYHSVAVSIARSLGYTGIVGSSTGNHGIAGAAYATVGGLRSLMFYPPEVPFSFLYLTALYGGRAAVTSSERRAEALAYVRQRPGWCPVDDTNPFGIEGYKTIAYEIVRDMGHAPEMVFIPVGSGTLFIGVFRGFRDLVSLGLIGQMPRLVACQARGVNILTQPFVDGKTAIPRREHIYTVALSTKEPTADPRVLDALRTTDGAVVTVGEREILAAVSALGREGLAAEPAAALSAAAVETLLQSGEIAADAEVVCILTSSLVTTPDLFPEVTSERPWRLGSDNHDLADHISRWDASMTDQGAG